MSLTHAEFTIERRFGCSPHQTFSAFSDLELKRQWFAHPGNWQDVFTEQGAFFDGLEDPVRREHGTGKLLDALARFLARERVR